MEKRKFNPSSENLNSPFVPCKSAKSAKPIQVSEIAQIEFEESASKMDQLELEDLVQVDPVVITGPIDPLRNVTICVENMKFKISEEIICNEILYFHNMFIASSMVESRTKEVTLKDVSCSTFKVIFNHIIGESVCLDRSNIYEVHRCAMMLQYDKLFKQCCTFLRKTISSSNFMEVWYHILTLDSDFLWEKEDLMEIKLKAVDYLLLTGDRIPLDTTPEVLRAILSDRYCYLDYKTTLKFVIQWIKHNVKDDIDENCDLFKHASFILENCINWISLSCLDIAQAKEVRILEKFSNLMTKLSSILNIKSELCNFCQRNLLLKNKCLSWTCTTDSTACTLSSNLSMYNDLKPSELWQQIYERTKKISFKVPAFLSFRYFCDKTCIKISCNINQKFIKFADFDCHLNLRELKGYTVCTIGGRFMYIIGGEFTIGCGRWNKEIYVLDTQTKEYFHFPNSGIPRRHFTTCISEDRICCIGGFGPYRLRHNSILTIDTKKNVLEDYSLLTQDTYFEEGDLTGNILATAIDKSIYIVTFVQNNGTKIFQYNSFSHSSSRPPFSGPEDVKHVSTYQNKLLFLCKSSIVLMDPESKEKSILVEDFNNIESNEESATEKEFFSKMENLAINDESDEDDCKISVHLIDDELIIVFMKGKYCYKFVIDLVIGKIVQSKLISPDYISCVSSINYLPEV